MTKRKWKSRVVSEWMSLKESKSPAEKVFLAILITLKMPCCQLLWDYSQSWEQQPKISNSSLFNMIAMRYFALLKITFFENNLIILIHSTHFDNYQLFFKKWMFWKKKNSPWAWLDHSQLRFSSICNESINTLMFRWILLNSQEKICVLDLTWLLLGKPARALLWLGFSQGKEPSQRTPAVDVLPHPGKNLVK